MGAVTQLLGWEASRRCSAEITTTTTTTPHPPFIPSFLFVCVLTRNKSSSGDSCSGGQCAPRAVMTEKERCPKVSERVGPQGLPNRKYGKGAVSPCMRWYSPAQPTRCCRSLQHYQLWGPKYFSPVLLSRYQLRVGTWVVMPLSLFQL